MYPDADAVIEAVPAVEEEKLTEQEPPVPVVQVVELNEPRFVENEMTTPAFPSEVVAVIVDEEEV